MKIKACLVTLALTISAALSAGAQSITYENGEGKGWCENNISTQSTIA